MRIEKQMLNDALRVLSKAVYQTSPVELYRSVRFVGDSGDVRAMVTDGVEVVSVKVESGNMKIFKLKTLFLNFLHHMSEANASYCEEKQNNAS